MNRKGADDKLLQFLLETHLKVVNNAEELLDDAISFYKKCRYERASLCAMTCIEECGKLWILRLLTNDVNGGGKASINNLDRHSITNLLRDHTQKALQLAASTFFINNGADGRQGVHPVSRTARTSGIVLLARSKRWMEWRNACQYVDIDVQSRSSKSPNEAIGRDVAYYFFCYGV